MIKRIVSAILVLTLCIGCGVNVFAAQTVPGEEINIEVTHSVAPIPYVDIYMSANRFKSYMSYKAITKNDSPQHLLQEMCYTDADGFRRCADRYVIAVGHGVGGQVGDCIDLILTNGQVIYCVIGDYKANKYTDAANLTGKNGCCSEFIVDSAVLRRDIKYRGTVGCGYIGWDSPVLLIRRYAMNYLVLDLGGSKE